MPTTSVNFNSDGVWYMDHALNVAQGRGLVDVDQQSGLSVRLFFPLLMGTVYRLTGPSEVATYMVLRLFFVLNILLVYCLASRLFGRFTGFTAASLVLTSFTLNEWQTIINLDYLLAFWLLFSVYLLYRAFESMRLPLFLLAGLAIGASISVKETAFVVAALPPLYWLMIPRYRSRRSLLGVAVALSPLIAAAVAALFILFSRGSGPTQLMGSFVPLLQREGYAFELPSPRQLAEILSTYYQMHMTPYFFLAPLLVVSWSYVAARSIFPRSLYRPYRFLTLTSLVFLPQTVVLGRIAQEQRPGQNFILFLLLYVALAAMACDLAVGVGRLLQSRLHGRMAASTGLMAPIVLVLLLVWTQATESQATWTKAPALAFAARGSMLDHWRRFNTIQYLRGSRGWTSQLDQLRDVSAWLNANATSGEPVLASLDTMRWLYWSTGGQYPMTPVTQLLWWNTGGGAALPEPSHGDIAMLVIESKSDDWRVLRQSTFFQALRSRSIRYIVLDARDGHLLPFLMEHPAFVLRKEINDRWLFEVIDDRLEPAPDLWRLVGTSQQEQKAIRTVPDRFQNFEQHVLKDTLGFTDAEIPQLLKNANKTVPLGYNLRRYVQSLSNMDPADLARLRRTFQAKVQARPNTAWSWVLLAQAERLQGDGQSALTALEEARALVGHLVCL